MRWWPALLVVACSTAEAPPPTVLAPLPLDVRLAAGEVRAGEITKATELIGGVGPRGAAGDFKLYNSKVRFIVARAGKAVIYNPYGGTVIDADIVREEGAPDRSNYGEVIVGVDLAILNPSKIEVLNDGRDGKAARIRASGKDDVFPLFDAVTGQLFDADPVGLDFSVEYVLEPDATWLRAEYTVSNPTRTFHEVGGLITGFLFSNGAQPFVPSFGYRPPSGGEHVEYFAAVDAEVSYLYGRPEVPLSVFITQSGVSAANHGNGFTLRPRDSMSFTHLIVVGDGDLSKTQAEWRRATAQPSLPALRGRVSYPTGEPIAGARVHLVEANAPNPAADYVSDTITDADGAYVLEAPAGAYLGQVSAADHLPSDAMMIALADRGATQDFNLDRPGAIEYRVVDEAGRALPSRLSVRPVRGDPLRLRSHYGQPIEPGGVLRTEHALGGEGRFLVPAGEHRVYVSRGLEYELAERVLTVSPGRTSTLAVTLRRVVDTTGWMSTDTHIHSQLSPDSPDLFEYKVAALVVEGLELPISTEHEAIGDFNPAIRALGLEGWMKGVVGSEITTFTYGHFNAWPLVPDPTKPGNGRIDWIYKDPAETFAAIRANPGQPFLQVNHPRSAAIGGYFSAMGYDPATGAARPVWSADFDGIEVNNGCGVGFEREEVVDWFSFLNRGVKKWALGSTDNHKARTGALGYPRTYVRMATDDPKAADVVAMRDAMRAGRMTISCGPFLELTVGEAGPGDTARVNGRVKLDLRVAAAPFVDVDRIEVVLNGTIVRTATVGATTEVERFRGSLEVPMPGAGDGWVLVGVRGDRRHGGHGGQSVPSWAYTNPIFLDGDGDGRWTMP